jgi:hypothetical protein
MTVADTHPDGTRSISVAHVAGGRHIVHGVYGFVPVNGYLDNYLTVTWAEAQPIAVVFTLTNPVTGASTQLYLHRGLLVEGGKPANVKVDFAGDITFIEITSAERITWIGLNRRWLADFLAATHSIAPCPAAPHPER